MSAVAGGTFVKATRTQRLIARRMVEATSGVPAFTVAADVELDAAVALRARLKAAGGAAGGTPAPSLNDMVLRAVALALRAHPRVNASFDAEAGGFHEWDRVNVGMAVAAGDALVVPTIHDADRKPLAEIAGETRALVDAVRERSVAPAQLADGTFTVSNLGMLGVRHFEAVINPPQAAILAVGALRPTAVPRPDGTIAAVSLATLTLTSDHRVIYGADAARFLVTVTELLEEPARL
ncbi:2-oxo acid dehydrogenase subunit E2 [Conexibacter woesei]|uniref:Dihydrolipoyllysine-residue acetyltransferase n=1 Tax=Conexibacter woesei (strain DSM 14684 / CCUG 47730 / CIP 108061 / JCM 11494 / NBRC 100937 / ID131577) TaxID=469383 RepID=D3F6T2_CONWI|nr:2-oxo acid dehydrogenase subunit E2 [Conexibacter woesei]ADB52730.1 Dihydrolipoyllysine-residue acetyltransferase [Conexibacter woesei DSM 14684]